jgi:hypothetical protein
MSGDSLVKKAEEALCAYDSSTRADRAARLIQIGAFADLPPAYMGRPETLHLLEETRQVFVNGHFVASLMLALSVIEHCIVEECELRGLIKESPPLSAALEIANQNGVLPKEWTEDISLLVKRRNPFAHLKPPMHQHGLGRRIRTEKRHPKQIVREDAELAVSYMYKVFKATLREAA